jgi:hypothetical protein
MAEQRMAVHAYLSVEAFNAWQAFAEENGVSQTGLLEALGLELLDEMEKQDPTGLRQPWVKEGRKIDAQRRRRGGSSSGSDSRT